jgi:FKBP-type peptidyl-prolyl cis-trans isomerase
LFIPIYRSFYTSSSTLGVTKGLQMMDLGSLYEFVIPANFA